MQNIDTTGNKKQICPRMRTMRNCEWTKMDTKKKQIKNNERKICTKIYDHGARNEHEKKNSRLPHGCVCVCVPGGGGSIKLSQSLSYQLTSNENKDRVVLVYGDRIQVRQKDLKKRGSHTCDMQALQPLPVPTTNTTSAMTTTSGSGQQPPVTITETA